MDPERYLVPPEEAARTVRVLRMYGLRDDRVIDAVSRVPRHLFIPGEFRETADPYGDHPCPIGHGQTISQPFVVAYMVSGLRVEPGMRVLEVGSGCGYAAAVLLELGAEVFGIEAVPDLETHSERVLASLGYSGFHGLAGDGSLGWPGGGPFDRILVSCAPETVPKALVEQLADSGRMILPVGPLFDQRLVVLEKSSKGVTMTEDLPVRFVPMTGSGGGKHR